MNEDESNDGMVHQKKVLMKYPGAESRHHKGSWQIVCNSFCLSTDAATEAEAWAEAARDFTD